MPILQAAGYDVPRSPTVAPASDANTPYQSSAGATPDAFGAQSAAAMSRFGAQMEQASNHLLAIAERHNEVIADDTANKAEDKINKIYYGDPDVPGDTGFNGMRGDQAMRAYPEVRKQIDQVFHEHRAALSTDAQKQRFDGQLRQSRNRILAQTGSHYDQQFHVYQADEAKSNAALNVGKVAGAAADGDQASFEQFVGKSLADAQDRGKRMGLPPAAIELEQQGVRQHAVKSWAEGKVARGDAIGADAFVEQNKGVLGDLYEPLKKQFRAEAEKQQAMTDAFGPSDGPVMVRGGAVQNAIGDTVDQFLGLAEHHESGGRNIMQQVVPAGGGYNPSTGGITGPSTAQGYYQITNSTWKDFAPKAGVDTSQYPNAMSAPKEVQHQVARRIVTDSGVQHWTSYNANLKSAVAAAGLPTSGIIQAGPPSGAASTAAPAPAPVGPPHAPPAPDASDRPDNAVPGLRAKLADLDQRAHNEGWDAERYQRAYSLVRTKLNAAYTDEQRQHQEQQRISKEIVDGALNEVIRDRYSDNPQLTAQQISTDHRFDTDPAARQRALGIMKPDRTAVDPVTSSNTMHDLMRGIASGEITDRGAIMDAFNEQPPRLNETHFNMLLKQVEDVRTPEGLKISKDIEKLVQAVKPSITKSNPLMGSLDASGDLQLGAFEEEVRNTVELMRKGGAKPREIADYLSVKRYRDNPELLVPYQTTVQDSAANISRSLSRTPPAPPPGSAQPSPAAPASGQQEFYAPIPPTTAVTPSSAVQPRQPGESVSDYMKRNGMGLPK